MIGPLDILQASSSNRNSDSIVSYMINMHEKLDRITEFKQENCQSAEKTNSGMTRTLEQERSRKEIWCCYCTDVEQQVVRLVAGPLSD